MLYVFLVDTGSMVTFDMNLALGTVAELQSAIYSKTRISEETQVLIMNGGESLTGSARVSSFSCAGTDTSPIFLFNRASIESETPAPPLIDYGHNDDLLDRYNSCLQMESNLNTIAVRTEFAKQIHENSANQVCVCEKLVYDQQLQHQGWLSVVANLEDIAGGFRDNWSQLEQSFDQFRAEKDINMKMLNDFDKDFSLLSKIPLIPALDRSHQTGESKVLTLYDWINQKDRNKSLEDVVSECISAYERFDIDSLNELKTETEDILSKASMMEMKEIRGLEERLYGLDILINDAQKLKQDQHDRSNALFKNQQRLHSLKDNSVIPDLCHTHKTQLTMMMQNLQQLRDIRRRCSQAKKELSGNIHLRLKWILHVEMGLSKIDDKIMVFSQKIKRLKSFMKVISQVHQAPKVYISAVKEVVRRKTFSQCFLDWSNKICRDSKHVHDEENKVRHQIMGGINGHFLSTIFPGINDPLPNLFIEAVNPFDCDLPDLSQEHLDQLKKVVPELCDSINLSPAHIDVIQAYFRPVSFEEGSPHVTPSTEVNSTHPLSPINNNIIELCEDTIQVNGRTFLTYSLVRNNLMNLLRQVQALKGEKLSLQETIIELSRTFEDSMEQVKQEITGKMIDVIQKVEARNESHTEHMEQEMEKKNQECILLNTEIAQLKEQLAQSKEEVARLTEKVALDSVEFNEESQQQKLFLLEKEVDLEESKKVILDLNKEVAENQRKYLEVNQKFKAQQDDIQVRTEKMTQTLRKRNEELQQERDELKVHIDQIRRKTEADLKLTFEAEKTRAVMEERDRIIAEKKREMEILRSRFRLASTVEKAQDTLISMESSGPTEMPHHATLMQENKTLREELKDLEDVRDREIKALKVKIKLLEDDASRDKLREMDLVIKGLRKEVETLQKERMAPDTKDLTEEVRKKEEEAKRFKILLKQKEQVIKNLRSGEALSLPSTDKVSILSCQNGDLVLFVFSQKYNSYVVFSMSPSLHFLDSSCVEDITKNATRNESDNSWCLAVVVNKEYSQAKRANNRYKMEIGTKFYCVKAIPYAKYKEGKKMTNSAMNPSTRSKDESSTSYKDAGDDIEGKDLPNGDGDGKNMSNSCFPHLK